MELDYCAAILLGVKNCFCLGYGSSVALKESTEITIASGRARESEGERVVMTGKCMEA